MNVAGNKELQSLVEGLRNFTIWPHGEMHESWSRIFLSLDFLVSFESTRLQIFVQWELQIRNECMIVGDV